MQEIQRRSRKRGVGASAAREVATPSPIADCSCFVHSAPMSRRVASRLEDLRGEDGHIALRCPRCGRAGAAALSDMIDHCHQRGIRTDWYVVAKLFRCSGCGQRPVQAHFALAPPPPDRVVPASAGVPKGISPRAWHSADSYERKRLIRRARG